MPKLLDFERLAMSAKVAEEWSYAGAVRSMDVSVATVSRLEDTLGGADLATAIPIALASGFVNSGQACIAGTRLLAPEIRLDEGLVRLKDHVETLKVGAATVSEARIGPMVSQKLKRGRRWAHGRRPAAAGRSCFRRTMNRIGLM
jgi:hypothetical protein